VCDLSSVLLLIIRSSRSRRRRATAGYYEIVRTGRSAADRLLFKKAKRKRSALRDRGQSIPSSFCCTLLILEFCVIDDSVVKNLADRALPISSDTLTLSPWAFGVFLRPSRGDSAAELFASKSRERKSSTLNMQGLTRALQLHGKALGGGILKRVSIRARSFSEASPSTHSLQEEGFENTTIADILKSKGQKSDGAWLWCETDDTVFEAVKKMTSQNVGALLVVKSGSKGEIAGIVSERDYLRKIIVQGRTSKTTKVGDIMTEENKLITVTPDTKVLRAMQLMTGTFSAPLHPVQ
jgi:CBS domain-containing protein